MDIWNVYNTATGIRNASAKVLWTESFANTSEAEILYSRIESCTGDPGQQSGGGMTVDFVMEAAIKGSSAMTRMSMDGFQDVTKEETGSLPNEPVPYIKRT